MRISSTVGNMIMLVLATILLTGCGGPSGKYEAKTPDGQLVVMTLDFKKGNKVDVAAMGQSAECDYTVDGGNVKIKPPANVGGGDTLVLTRKGKTYEADMGGEKVVFSKKE